MRFLAILLVILPAGLAMQSSNAQTLDLSPLWDFARPQLSEQRFRDALKTASGDDTLILQTQIARSYGLRGQFDDARKVLAALEPQVAQAGIQAQVHFHLERGRTFASAKHDIATLSAADKAQARQAFERALALARSAQLDGLAIDAIHMFAFIDPSPADQLRWGQEALAVVLASQQPQGQRWEASVRNNLGYALHQLGRYEEALAEFRMALGLRERGSNPAATRSARWMVAWTLRALGRSDEAIEMQLALEKDAEAAGAPDRYVFEELQLLFGARGDTVRAGHYAAKLAPLKQR